MGNGKKVAIVVVLLAAIVVAVVQIVRKSMGLGSATPPEWVLRERQEKIDEKTLKLITKPMGEWQSLGEKGGKFKNPETGKYTMVPPIICFSCGEKIPSPDYSSATAASTPGSTKLGPPEQDILAAVHKISAAYKCPRCGKPAFDANGRSGIPKAEGAGGAGK